MKKIYIVLAILSIGAVKLRSPKDAANQPPAVRKPAPAATMPPIPTPRTNQTRAFVLPPPAPKTVIVAYELDMQGQGARGWLYDTNGRAVWTTNFFAPGILSNLFVSGLMTLDGRNITNAAYARSNRFVVRMTATNESFRAFWGRKVRP